MLLDNGADPIMKTEKEMSAFGICLKQKKFGMIELFLDNVSFNSDPDLIFEFVDYIHIPEYVDLFKKIIEKEKINIDVLNKLDKDGFTPFLRMVKTMVRI